MYQKLQKTLEVKSHKMNSPLELFILTPYKKNVFHIFFGKTIQTIVFGVPGKGCSFWDHGISWNHGFTKYPSQSYQFYINGRSTKNMQNSSSSNFMARCSFKNKKSVFFFNGKMQHFTLQGTNISAGWWFQPI